MTSRESVLSLSAELAARTRPRPAATLITAGLVLLTAIHEACSADWMAVKIAPLHASVMLAMGQAQDAQPGTAPNKSDEETDAPAHGMVLVQGGVFDMGDWLEEASDRERPTHAVTLHDYYLGRCEVTVAEFRDFVEDTGYLTSAEGANSEGEAAASADAHPSGDHLPAPGAWVWSDGDFAWRADANWRRPCVEQADDHPVTCVSWMDAIHYCNWLSRQAGLPIAYDGQTGDLLDAEGHPTADITKVQGYRLPTEAEWEYAARGRGRKVRFGTGKSVARSDEINFDAAHGEFPYCRRGQYRGGTTPVGQFKPNRLGLHDMSGNVWEWCSDFVGRYSDQAQVNPYQTEGVQSRRAARGGRWGGTADEARVFVRMGWESRNRCNNIGLRVARTR